MSIYGLTKSLCTHFDYSFNMIALFCRIEKDMGWVWDGYEMQINWWSYGWGCDRRDRSWSGRSRMIQSHRYENQLRFYQLLDWRFHWGRGSSQNNLTPWSNRAPLIRSLLRIFWWFYFEIPRPQNQALSVQQQWSLTQVFPNVQSPIRPWG